MPGLPARERARTQRDAIAAHLRDLLESQPEGARLPAERRLAEQFGAHRQTVRAALASLEADGALSRRRGSGRYVARPAPHASPQDVLEARRVIEPNWCGLVAARATEADFARMEARLREMEAADETAEFKEAGYRFHLEVARATRNPLLVALYELLVAARARAGWAALAPLNDRPELRADQVAKTRAILAALRMRDGERARRLLRDSLDDMARAVARFPPGV